MAHTSAAPISITERDFRELMQRGDDFFKIELLRPAKAWYQRALAMNLETETVKYKISECDRLLAYEMKVFKILGVAAFLLIIASLVIINLTS